MKQSLITTCIAVLALGLTARGAENEVRKGRPAKAAAVQKAGPATVRGQARVQRNISTPRVTQRSSINKSAAVVRQNNLRSNRIQNVRGRSLSSNSELRATKRAAINRNQNAVVNRERNLNRNQNLAVNRERNLNRARNLGVNRERDVTINRQRNVTINNNWRGERFRGQNYAAFRNYHREWHNRDWWHHHHNRIVFVLGGWYFWNSGYWYPAWGYDPGYNYPYDGPIYGYNDLTPDQVIVNVQAQLQRDGYYAGPVDGLLGPMTRRAIAAFQADNGLAVTSAIDEPTLATLGLV